MKWYGKAWTNFIKFSGRAHRKEFWYFILFDSLFTIILYFFDMLRSTEVLPILTVFYTIASFVPWLGVSVRRLHDTGHTARALLIMLLPLIYIIILARDGETGENKYGQNPKEILIENNEFLL